MRTWDVQIIVKEHADAEEILNVLRVELERRKFVSVSDLYDLVDFASDFKDVRRGWTNLTDAEIIPAQDGYLIQMPSTEPLA